tara:strand:+ start:741 stop:950 length:210 start_codon:yes stop_codon:yes gene_type:complete
MQFKTFLKLQNILGTHSSRSYFNQFTSYLNTKDFLWTLNYEADLTENDHKRESYNVKDLKTKQVYRIGV